MPKRYWGDYELGDWAYRLRLLLKDKQLDVAHFEALEAMSFPWVVPVVSLTSRNACHTVMRQRHDTGVEDTCWLMVLHVE